LTAAYAADAQFIDEDGNGGDGDGSSSSTDVTRKRHNHNRKHKHKHNCSIIGCNKHVMFDDEIEMHIHETVLGQHPDCPQDGPPIELGWKYNVKKGTLCDSHHDIIHLNSIERQNKLKEYGFTQQQMDDAIKEVHRIHFNRIQSSHTYPGSYEERMKLQRRKRHREREREREHQHQQQRSKGSRKGNSTIFTSYTSTTVKKSDNDDDNNNTNDQQRKNNKRNNSYYAVTVNSKAKKPLSNVDDNLNDNLDDNLDNNLDDNLDDNLDNNKKKKNNLISNKKRLFFWRA
jgi:hypothetical protein